MKIRNLFQELETTPQDPLTGIKLTRLTGDEKISVYAAEISANTALKAHYHEKGIETYQIIGGKGKMKIGDIDQKQVNWTEEFEVISGDCFSIEEGMVHKIINESGEPLKAIFTCPESHIGNDRFFIE